MIPSDHFVRYYNEVFKAVSELGIEHLISYWRELGRNQREKLGEKFRAGGLQACFDYWSQIKKEENCAAKLTLTDDYLDIVMEKCPSLSKVLDNDSEPFPLYCDHCMGWVEPVMEYAKLYPVIDMISRKKPECRLRVYRDRLKSEEFSKNVRLRSQPYREHGNIK